MPHTLALLSLPDDVLALACEKLSLLERHQALPLTCRRLSRVVNAPQLLRTVEFDSTGSILDEGKRGTYLPRARSFACWAVRHAAGAVQRLVLRIGAPYPRSVGEDEAICSEIMGALAACGAGGSLQEVSLEMPSWPASLPAWLPVALRGVRLLHIIPEGRVLQVDVPLTPMAALADLALDGSKTEVGLRLGPAAALPPTLERLHIGDICWGEHDPPRELPPQVTVLPALKCLILETCAFTQQGLEPLAQLAGSLEALRISFCHWPPSPATLARLTRLTFLDADNFIGDREESLDDAAGMLEDTLAALPQLRALRVSFASSGYYMSAPAFPRALTALQHLQHLVCDLTTTDDDALPPGSWLSGLLSLALPGDAIPHNTAALASMPLLQHLMALQPRDRDLYNRAPAYGTWHPGTVQWAAGHPSLRCLDIEVPLPHLQDPTLGAAFKRANTAAMRRNPNLNIHVDSRVSYESLEQFLERGGFVPV